MPRLLNAVRVNCPTTGTGATLAIGSAVSTAYQTPGAAGAVAGDTYTITIDDGAQREITAGTVGAGATSIDRAATPIWSSTGGRLNLSGAAIISFGPAAADLMNPDLSGTPGAPPAGLVRLGETALAGCDWPSWRSAQTPERFVNPLLSRTRWGAWVSSWNTSIPIGLNVSTNISQLNVAAVGSNFANTSYASRQPYINHATGTTAGTLAYTFNSNNASRQIGISAGGGVGGFLAVFRFFYGTGANTVTAFRSFVGLSFSNVAPTNVDQSTLLNIIGIGKPAGSNNLSIFYGGTTAQMPIDLGADFPANTVNNDLYEFILFSDPNDVTKLNYQVNRWSGSGISIFRTVTGTIGNTTPGTTLPTSGTAMGPHIWVTNNTTAANVELRFSSFHFWADA